MEDWYQATCDWPPGANVRRSPAFGWRWSPARAREPASPA